MQKTEENNWILVYALIRRGDSGGDTAQIQQEILDYSGSCLWHFLFFVCDCD